jgi:hypothetical protein
MYIEDIILRLGGGGNYLFATYIPMVVEDRTVVASLVTQIERDVGFTEKQRSLAARIITRYITLLSVDLGVDIRECLASPQYRLELRVLPLSRRVFIKETAPNYDAKIIVQFPYDTQLINQIKEYKRTVDKKEYSSINWNPLEKGWELGLSESSLVFLSGFLPNNQFTADEPLLSLIEEVRVIQENIEQYVPMVAFEDNKIVFKNVPNVIPQPANHLITALLQARKYGINCWDDTINLMFEQQNCNSTVEDFLRNTSDVCIPAKGEAPLTDITDIIKFSENVLFIIPGGSEMKHLQVSHEFLLSLGFTNEQMSVMFRIDSTSGKLCNSYIRDNALNNALSENIKVVFVSGKIPKPLIESRKEFDLVVHYGTNSAHYTLKNFIRHHHNVVTMNLNSQKELTFG